MATTALIAPETRRMSVIGTAMSVIVIVIGSVLMFPLPFDHRGTGAPLAWTAMLGLALPPTFGDYCIVVAMITLIVSLLVRLHGSTNAMFLSAVGLVLIQLWNASTHAAIIALSLWSGFFLAAHIGMNGAATGSPGRAIRLTWSVMFAIQMIVAIAAYLVGYGQLITPGFGARASGLYGSPNVVYPLAILSLFWFAAMTRSTEQRTLKLLFAGMVALSAMVLLLTFSRAGWLGLAVSLTIINVRRNVGRLAIACMLTAALLVVGVFALRSGGIAASTHADRSMLGRTMVWMSALRHVADRPLSGGGYNSFREYNDIGFALHTRGLGVAPSEPKNLILNWLLDVGLIGTILYAFFFYSTFRVAIRVQAIKESCRHTYGIARCLTMSLTALLIAGLFDTPFCGLLDRTPVTFSLLVLSGLLFGSQEGHRQNS